MTSTAVQSTAEAPSLRKFLENHKGKIAEAAANKVSPDRLLRVALVAANKNQALFRCTPESVLLAVIQAATLGLEAGSALGDAYLVPYGTECTLIIGYRGFITLARRSGTIQKVEARPVFDGEAFRVRYGTNPGIDHEPVFDNPRTRAELVAVYAVWTMNDGSQQFDVMSAAEIEAIRQRSRAKDNGPWKTDYVEMAKKTVLRRSAKLVPLSVEMAEALEADAESEYGSPTPEARIGIDARLATGATARLKEKVGVVATEAVREPAREPAREVQPATEKPAEQPPADAKPDAETQAKKAKAWSRFQKLLAKGAERTDKENEELDDLGYEFPEFREQGGAQ